MEPAGAAVGSMGQRILLRWRRGDRTAAIDHRSGPCRHGGIDSPPSVPFSGFFPAARPASMDAVSRDGPAHQCTSVQSAEHRTDHDQLRSYVDHDWYDAAVHSNGDGVVWRGAFDVEQHNRCAPGRRGSGDHQLVGRRNCRHPSPGNRAVPRRGIELRVRRALGATTPEECTAAQVGDLPASLFDPDHGCSGLDRRSTLDAAASQRRHLAGPRSVSLSSERLSPTSCSSRFYRAQAQAT